MSRRSTGVRLHSVTGGVKCVGAAAAVPFDLAACSLEEHEQHLRLAVLMGWGGQVGLHLGCIWTSSCP